MSRRHVSAAYLGYVPQARSAAKKAKRDPTAEEAALIAKADALRDVLIQVRSASPAINQ